MRDLWLTFRFFEVLLTKMSEQVEEREAVQAAAKVVPGLCGRFVRSAWSGEVLLAGVSALGIKWAHRFASSGAGVPSVRLSDAGRKVGDGGLLFKEVQSGCDGGSAQPRRSRSVPERAGSAYRVRARVCEGQSPCWAGDQEASKSAACGCGHVSGDARGLEASGQQAWRPLLLLQGEGSDDHGSCHSDIPGRGPLHREFGTCLRLMQLSEEAPHHYGVASQSAGDRRSIGVGVIPHSLDAISSG